MPHYHRYGLRWAKVRICIFEITIPHQLGKYWRYKPPFTLTYLQVAKPGDSGYLHAYVSWFFFVISSSRLYIELYSIQETLRLALALGTLAFLHRFLLMLQIPTTSGNCSNQLPH